MRWKRKIKKAPELGDTRIVEKFLIFPKLLDDEWRWLESSHIKQEFKEFNAGIERSCYVTGWVDKNWVDLNKPLRPKPDIKPPSQKPDRK